LSTVQRTELSDQFALLVDAVQKYGIDNISQISRQIGIPIETVRYKIKKQLPSLGINVQLRFDHNRLGLRLFFGELEFTEDVEQRALQIFSKLHEVAFLTYYARELGNPCYTVSFAVPFGLVDEWQRFLNKLIPLKVLQNYSVKEIAWRRLISISPENFDFANKSWTLDAFRRTISKDEKVLPCVDLKERFSPDMAAVNIDKIDLLIIKELEKNAALQLSKMSKILKINEKTIGYHYRKHVRMLTPQTYFAWAGDASDERNGVVLLRYIFDGLTFQELEGCRRIFSNFPFTWGESGGRGGYYAAEVMMPQNYYSWTTHFLRTKLAREYHKAKLIFLDANDDRWYTVPYYLFDKEIGGWYFDEHKAINEVLKILECPKPVLSEK
jgi:DNA-binding Lrp family transcriptional regulator